MNANPQPAGTLTHLRRYPVKGMSGEDLNEVFVTFAGLLGDRVYAFFDPKSPADFQWITPRLLPEMLLLKPSFVSPPSAQQQLPSDADYHVEVATPEGKKFDVSAADLRAHLEEKLGRPIALRFSERSMTDSRPVSILGRQSLEALSSEACRKLEARRFRANFVIDWSSGGAFHEDSLLGRQVRIGSEISLMISKRDSRCKVITLDPDTAQSAPEVLEVIVKKHAGCAGVYATVLREGIVRRGDPVFVD